MVNVKDTIVAELETLSYPVYYEAFLGEDVEIPAISYLEITDVDTLVGTTVEYSEKVFQLKLWSKRISEIDTMAKGIDTIMKDLGFRRIYTNEFPVDGIVNKVMRYRALAKNYK